jgi:hypothetical protein
VTELVRGLTSGDLDHSMDGVFSSKFRDLISAFILFDKKFLILN